MLHNVTRKSKAHSIEDCGFQIENEAEFELQSCDLMLFKIGVATYRE